jgi:hypothetical protein
MGSTDCVESSTVFLRSIEMTNDVQLVLGQLMCGSFRVEPPFFGAAPHVETY